MSDDSRFPYTYAYDYIRSLVGYDERGHTKLNRSDVVHIIKVISRIIGIDEESIVTNLAIDYLNKQDEIEEKNVHELTKIIEKISNDKERKIIL